MIEDFSSREKKGEVCRLPGIYYYSMNMQQPVALSFDLYKKNSKTISAVAASEKFKKKRNSPNSKGGITMEKELRDLRSSSKASNPKDEESDNVELDSEGRFEDYCVVKQRFEFENNIVTV